MVVGEGIVCRLSRLEPFFETFDMASLCPRLDGRISCLALDVGFALLAANCRLLRVAKSLPAFYPAGRVACAPHRKLLPVRWEHGAILHEWVLELESETFLSSCSPPTIFSTPHHQSPTTPTEVSPITRQWGSDSLARCPLQEAGGEQSGTHCHDPSRAIAKSW